MILEDYSNHPLHQSIEKLKQLIGEKKEFLDKPENLELNQLMDAVCKIKDLLDKTNVFIIHVNDLNVMNQHLANIINNFSRFNGNYDRGINDNIHTSLSNIYHILAKFPKNDKNILNQAFNKIAETYKHNSEEFKNKLDNDFTKSKTEYDNYIKDIEKDREYLKSIVGDVKDFSAKYTTQEKAKYYQGIAIENENKADSFLKYTSISMFFALGFILIPILLPIVWNIILNIFVAPFVASIDIDWVNIFPKNLLDLNISGALLKIMYSFVAFFPVLFFARFEKIYRDRAFKFNDLKNAILSINPYLSDIENKLGSGYDEKDRFKLEMARIFFTQIHSTKKESDTDILKKFEQLSNILKGLK